MADEMKLKVGITIDKSSANKKLKNELDAIGKNNKLKLEADFSSFLKENSKINQTTKSVKELEQHIKNINDKTDLRKARSEFALFKSEMEEANLVGRTFREETLKNLGKVANWMLLTTATAAVLRNITEMVTSVYDLDKAMVNLRKVTSETDTTYNQFLDRAAQSAKELGSSMPDLVESTADFARLGFKLPDAEELSKVATLYKNVGDLDISEATQNIISISKAYGIEADNAITIVDKLNQVGNNFAISSAGLGEALRVGGAALSAANNSLDESIALITAGNNALQDPDTVGQALKTVSMRIRNTKGELEDLGEEADGAAESITKLQTQILNRTGGKVDIMLDENTFKNTYQVLNELSKVWNDLTDKSRADILDLIAGKHRATAVASILTNMKDGEDALTTSINSAGSAMKEQEKYSQGIEYSLDRLNATLDNLSRNTIDSGFIKSMIDMLTVIVEAIDKFGLINTVILTTSVSLIAFNKNIRALYMTNVVGGLEAIIAKLLGLTTTLNLAEASAVGLRSILTTLLPVALLTGALVLGKVISDNIKKTNELKDATEIATKSYKDLKSEVDSTNNTFKSTTSEIEAQAKTAQNYANTLKELSEKTSLNSYEQAQMQLAVKNLNDIIPDLNLSIDATTGKLSMQRDEIEKSIDAFKRLSLAQAYQSIVGEKSKELAEAQLAKDKAQTERDKLGDYKHKPWSDGLTKWGSNGINNGKIIQAEEKIGEYDKVITGLQSDIDKATEKYNEYASELDNVLNTTSNNSSGGGGGGGENGGSSSTVDTPAYKDLTQAIVDAINQQSVLDQKQNDSLSTQISQAEAAGDYVKQIELQNQLLANQQKTVTDLKLANDQIHAVAEKIRATTSYDTESWFNADGSDTVAYLNLFNSSSKDAQENIQGIHDQLKTLKDGWTANKEAIDSMNQSLQTTVSAVDSIARDALQTVADVEDQIVELYEKEFDKKKDKLEEWYDEEKEAAEESYNHDKELLDKKLENFQKYIQEQKDALNDAYDEDTFNSDLAEKQAELAKIQAEYNSYTLSAKSGDRSAIAAQTELAEEIADKQKEIDELVAERAKTLQEDALDDALTDYEDYISDKQEQLDEDYAREVEQIDKLYQKKLKKLEENYSKEELYSKARKALMSGEYSEITSLFEEFQNDQVNGWSSIGDTIQSEFVDKLQAAVDLMAELEEGGLSSKQLNEAFENASGSDSGSSGGGSSSGKSHTTLGGGFEKMSNSDWEDYKENKRIYESSSSSKEDKELAAFINKQLRTYYGIASDKYSYNDIKGYYADGGSADFTGLAMLHGSKTNTETIFNSADSSKLYELIHSNSASDLAGMVFKNLISSIGSSALGNVINKSSTPIQIGSLVTIEGSVTDGNLAKVQKTIDNGLAEFAKKINSGNITLNKGTVL